MSAVAVAVTGVGLAMPGVDAPDQLLSRGRRGAEPVDPATRLGRKGLRYKDRATQLGLAAVDAALVDGGLRAVDTPAGGPIDESIVQSGQIAVVVGSNFGNLDTVARIVATIATDGGATGVSPMDTPNASSNEVAAAVAIRYGLRGPNLTFCNGPTTGIDSLRWASLLLTAGRARCVVVVGVEPDNEVVSRLTGGRPTIDGAAAVVLETADSAHGRGATVRAWIGGFARGKDVRDCLSQFAGRDGAPVVREWYVPETDRPLPSQVLPIAVRHNLGERWGLASAALGVLQCAAAVSGFAGGSREPVYAVSGTDGDDASAGVLLLPPRTRASAK